MDVQQQQCNYPSPFRSKLDLQHRFYEEWTRYHSEDETPIPPKPTNKRTLFLSSAVDEKASTPHLSTPESYGQSKPDRSAAPQDVPQRAPSPHSVPPPPLSAPPKLHFSRPNGFDDLLHPISGEKISASRCQHDGEGTDSPLTAPMAAKSRLPTPSLPSTSMNKHSLRDFTLPSNAPALTNTYPYPLATIEARQSSFRPPRDQASAGSGPLLPSETATAWSTFTAAHTSSAPNLATLTNLASQNPSLTAHYRHNSPSSALPQVASAGEAQSSFSAPFTSDSASTMPQLEFAKQTLDAPTPGASGQSQSRMMIYETEQGVTQVPVDLQATSKTANEKRKRNATASHRFRQRRKEREGEMSNTISKLEADVKYYQLERDFLQDLLQKKRIPIPTRAPSPRRRRHASLGGSQNDDTGTPAQNGGRNTRRQTSAYAPPRWVEPPPPMLLPSEHIH
ncbi:hypothetical protein ABVK25_010785 [Lepraria finkii]|uniref:BZIP domain-containing protein n=1 Tax=Lepraria finkii TaxID=1340010 RepID=A0ABR4AVK9_9LECA